MNKFHKFHKFQIFPQIRNRQTLDKTEPVTTSASFDCALRRGRREHEKTEAQGTNSLQNVLRKSKMADFDISANFIPSLHKSSSLLPIARHRQTLLYLIETYPITIVVGQTGSGKTTQICQYLEQAGWCADGKIIGITQVRSLSGIRSIPIDKL